MKRSVKGSLAALTVVSVTLARQSWATPGNAGFQPQTVAMATFDELNINLHTIPADIWQARLKTQGNRTCMFNRTSGLPAAALAGTRTRGPSWRW